MAEARKDPVDSLFGLPLMLIDARRSAVSVDPGLALLGLTLAERLARAARRSGFGTIVILAEPGEADRLRAPLLQLDSIHVGEIAHPAIGGIRGGSRIVCAAASIVAERGWLEAAATMPVAERACLRVGEGVVVCGAAASVAEAAEALDRAPAAAPPATGAPMVLRTAADLPAAERRLLRALGKSTDGFMERNIERPVSRLISARLARLRVTPNQMTLVSALVGLAAAPFFLSASPLWQTAGALLFLAHSILDGCDGELARLKFQESRWGGILDFWVDNIVHSAIFGCMAIGWSTAIGAAWPLALGIAAVFGTLGSAGFVYWRVMRPKRGHGPLYVSVSTRPSGGLTAMLDSLSRRDFIYLVLALSIPGKAAWFLAMAAVGAPAFFVLLLIVAAKDRRTGLAAA